MDALFRLLAWIDHITRHKIVWLCDLVWDYQLAQHALEKAREGHDG